jgi:hypothetical protein
MGKGLSLKNKLGRGEIKPHVNKWQEFSHADEILRQRIERVYEELRRNGRSEDSQESSISEFGMWWRYHSNGREILFMKRKRKDGDGFSSSEVEEIATQVEEASLVSYNSNKMQHLLVRCKKKEFYVEINSMGDVRLPCATRPTTNSRGTKYFIRTDDPYEVANFSTIWDWGVGDFRESRKSPRINY